MKKYIIVSAFLAVAFTASAQLLSDDSVQLCAYWEEGEKYQFNEEKVKLEIVGTDTTVTERITFIRTLEVIAEEDDMYRFRMTASDYHHSDPVLNKLMETLAAKFGNRPIEFETDEVGILQRVLPVDWGDSHEELVQEAIKAVREKLDTLQDFAPAFIENLVRTMLDPQSLMASAATELVTQFQFYGHQYDIGRDYEYQIEAVSPYPTLVPTLTMDGIFWVDEEDTDEDILAIGLYQKADEASLKKLVREFIGSLGTKLIASEAPEAPADSVDSVVNETLGAIDEAMDSLTMELTDRMYYVFDLESGWPLYFGHTRALVTISGENSKIKLETLQREMIY